ncbi:SCAN domain-containing protein 3 [Trichonephila clavipes]|nr:SCAN domain-containing protein 3 [Trichonephila clavipes]
MCRLSRDKHVLTSPFVPVGDRCIWEATTEATKLCTYSQLLRERLHPSKHGKKKKKKRTEEHREFYRDWTESFTFIRNSDGLTTCLICHENLAHCKKSNLERYFITKHTQFASKYAAGEERKKAVDELQNQKQQSSSILSNWTQSTSNVNLASFVVSLDIAKKAKHSQMVSMSKIASYVHLKNSFMVSKTNQKS